MTIKVRTVVSSGLVNFGWSLTYNLMLPSEVILVKKN